MASNVSLDFVKNRILTKPLEKILEIDRNSPFFCNANLRIFYKISRKKRIKAQMMFFIMVVKRKVMLYNKSIIIDRSNY